MSGIAGKVRLPNPIQLFVMIKSCIIFGLMYLIDSTVSSTSQQFGTNLLKDAIEAGSTSLANANASDLTNEPSDGTTPSDSSSTEEYILTSSDNPNDSDDPQPTGSNEFREINPLTTKHKTIFFISAATTFFILICSACISNLCDYSKLSKQKLARSHA
ncbi:unnamed protein product [Auanema sp. JU1783]|nr:unnamed protein product [Auanema sp. JU1783]